MPTSLTRNSFGKASFIVLLFLSACSNSQGQQKAAYAKRIDTVYSNIYRHFYDSSRQLFLEKTELRKDERPFAYLWPLCALVQAANDLEVLYPARKYMAPVMQVIDKYYSPAKPPHPGYDSYPVEFGGGDRFYDDNQWIGIAYMDAYNRTKDAKFLLLSRDIYDFMLTGYDTNAGGGLYWKELDHTTKNTCSNGPGILLGLQLYKATGEKRYLDTALLLYDWTNKKLSSQSGLYYDAIKIPSGKIDKRIYSYNTGTMLQSSALLYQVTKNQQYLRAAQEMAAASLQHFFKDDLFPENYWFNAVLLRGYEELFRIDNEKKYLSAFKKYADKVWQTQSNPGKLIGKRKVSSLIDQAGYLEIIARLARYE